MKKKYNFLLSGHGGCINRGCEAILRCTIDIINRHFSNPNINLISSNPESDFIALKKTNSIKKTYQSFCYGQRYSVNWFINTISRFLLQGSTKIYLFKNRRIYKEADIFIHIGGDNFCYGGEQLWFDELNFVRRLGAKTIIWGASIGPFSKKDECKWAHELRKVDLITVRETKTLNYLNEIGVSSNVKLIADPAFLLPVEEIGKNQFKHKKNGEIVVGLGMSSLVSKYSINHDKYIDSFFAFAQKILKNENIKIIIIPHVYDAINKTEDLKTCQILYKKLNDNTRIILCEENYNACQLKYIISSCDFFIGARTHSTIASISTKIPTISIAYSTKAYGLNQTLFGHTDYVVPIEDIDQAILFDKFNLLLKNRDQIIHQIESSLEKFREMAESGGIYLKEIINAK